MHDIYFCAVKVQVRNDFYHDIMPAFKERRIDKFFKIINRLLKDKITCVNRNFLSNIDVGTSLANIGDEIKFKKNYIHLSNNFLIIWNYIKI